MFKYLCISTGTQRFRSALSKFDDTYLQRSPYLAWLAGYSIPPGQVAALPGRKIFFPQSWNLVICGAAFSKFDVYFREYPSVSGRTQRMVMPEMHISCSKNVTGNFGGNLFVFDDFSCNTPFSVTV